MALNFDDTFHDIVLVYVFPVLAILTQFVAPYIDISSSNLLSSIGDHGPRLFVVLLLLAPALTEDGGKLDELFACGRVVY